jgi:hypothetical protein
MRRKLRDWLRRWWHWASGARARAYSHRHQLVLAGLTAARIEVTRILERT